MLVRSTMTLPEPSLSRRSQNMLSFAREFLYYRDLQGNVPPDYVNLGMAENLLTKDLVEERLDHCRRVFQQKVNGHYEEYRGTSAFREALADYFAYVLETDVNPSCIVAGAGATALIEMLMFSIAGPGDVILAPVPRYPGFDVDIGARSGVEMQPVRRRIEDGYRITEVELSRAMSIAHEAGKRVSGILFSNPDNPTGKVYSTEELQLLVTFAETHDLHIISDEIYAGSLVKGKFCSLLRCKPASNRIHVVTGLSKDFCLAGFRTGCVISNHSDLLSALGKLCRFSSISVDTQQLLTQFLSDKRFIQYYTEINRKRLEDRHHLVELALLSLGIKSFGPSTAGLCAWLDLREYMKSPTKLEEERIFNMLLEKHHVRLTPGQCCHSIEMGFFRACVTAEQDWRSLEDALSRVALGLKQYSQAQI